MCSERSRYPGASSGGWGHPHRLIRIVTGAVHPDGDQTRTPTTTEYTAWLRGAPNTASAWGTRDQTSPLVGATGIEPVTSSVSGTDGMSGTLG